MTINEAVVQKNCVKALYRHGKPLEEKLALSDLAGGRTNSAPHLRQEINSRVIDWAQCLQCDWLKQIRCWKIRVFCHLSCCHHLSCRYPPVLEVALMYESARVAATVTSHDRGFLVCHGSKVRPSGRLPSLRERPVGSLLLLLLHLWELW